MPVKPGEILNPNGSDGGKKRLYRQLADKLMHNVDAAAKFVEHSLGSESVERKEWATELIFDRVYGKAPQSIEMTGADGAPFSIMLEKALTADDFAKQFAPKVEE